MPMQDDEHVILIRQLPASIRRELWELPAGSLEPGETADAAAARECEEEIGLVPGRIERLRGLFPTPGFCDEELIFFRVSACGRPTRSAAQARRGRGHPGRDLYGRGGQSDGRPRRDRRSEDRLRADIDLNTRRNTKARPRKLEHTRDQYEPLTKL